MFGLYNKFMGNNLNNVLLRHEPVLRDLFREKLGIDIIQRAKNETPSILDFDDDITAPLFGWKDREDYYYKAACYHRIPGI